LATAAILALGQCSAGAVEDISTYSDLKSKMQIGGDYNLVNDITADYASSISIPNTINSFLTSDDITTAIRSNYASIFSITSGGTLSLSNLTLEGNKYSPSNLISNGSNGTISSLSNVIFQNNYSSYEALENNGKITTIDNVIFRNNNSLDSSSAIYISGSTTVSIDTISNTLFSNNNSANSTVSTYNSGIKNIDSSLFVNNTSTSYGGAISSTGTLTVTDTSFFGNRALSSGYGGAISTTGTLNINATNKNVLFENNYSSFYDSHDIWINSTAGVYINTYTSKDHFIRFGGGIASWTNWNSSNPPTITVDGYGKVYMDKPLRFYVYAPYPESFRVDVNLKGGELKLKQDTALNSTVLHVNTKDSTGNAQPTLNTINNTIGNIAPLYFDIKNSSTLKVKLDADPNASTIDKIAAIRETKDQVGFIDVSDIHLLSDSDSTKTLSVLSNVPNYIVTVDSLPTILTDKNLYNVEAMGQNLVLTKNTKNFDGLSSAIQTITSNRSISLLNDVNITSTFTDQNGKTKTYTGNTATSGTTQLELNIYGNNHTINAKNNKHITVSNSTKLNLQNAKITNFNSTDNGGAILNQGKISEINNVIFENNKSSAKGSAIYNDASATIQSITNSTFKNNTATNKDASIVNANTATINEIGGSTFVNDDNDRLGISNSGEIQSTYNNTFTKSGIENSGTIDLIHNSKFTDNNTLNYIANTVDGEINGIYSTEFTENKTIAISNDGTIKEISNSTFKDNNNAISSTGTIDDISESIFENNSNTTDGGAITSTGNLKTVSKTTFKANKATNGGAIHLNNADAKTSFANNQFNDNSATTAGGAIYNQASKNVKILNSEFSNNNATLSGGAIQNSGVVSSIDSTIFENNYVLNGDGGAIYNSVSASINSISNSIFNSNGANSTINGGAIANLGTINTIENSSFTNNKAKVSGGAIYNTGDNLTIVDTNFINNTATEKGGAIYTNKNISIKAVNKNVTFQNNSATKGSDIYLDSGANLDLNPDDNKTITFFGKVMATNNSEITIDGLGQVIFNNPIEKSSTSDIVKFNLYSGETKPLTNSYFAGLDFSANSTASTKGGTPTLNLINGEVSALNTNKFDVTGDLYVNIEVDGKNSTMDTISSVVNGSTTGQIIINAINLLSPESISSKQFITQNPNITLKNNVTLLSDKNLYTVTVSGQNISITKGTTDFSGFQSAIAEFTGNRSVSLLNNIAIDTQYKNSTGTLVDWDYTVKSGTVNVYGNNHTITAKNPDVACIYIDTDSTLNLYDVNFKDFQMPDTYGSVIYNSGSLNVYNSSFRNGLFADNGGAIYSDADLNVNISNSKFINNTSSYSGGAIQGGTISLANSIFANNTTDSYGGAVSTDSSYGYGIIDNIENSLFAGNTATYGYGGAIYSEDSIISISNSSFIGNTTRNTGSAINGYTVNSITNSLFEGNIITSTSSGNAGAISFNYANTINNSSFIANFSPIGRPAININSYQLDNLNNSLFKYNNSYFETSVGYIKIATLIDNTIFDKNKSLDSSSLLDSSYIQTLRNSVISNNKGATFSSTHIDLIDNTTFKNNISQMSSMIYNNSYIGTIKNSLFENNYTYSSGGVIANSTYAYVENIDNNTFRGNKTLDSGGVLHTSFGIERNHTNIGNITNSIFENNKAKASGGVIYMEPYSAISNISDSTFRNNSSLSNGGVFYVTSQLANIKNSEFSNNKSVFGYGGVIAYYKEYDYYYSIATSEINNSAFLDNSAFSYGGAILITRYHNGISSISDTDFLGNTTSVYTGGAIHDYYGSAMKISAINKDVVFKGNQTGSNKGNDIYIESASMTLSPETNRTIYFGDGISGANATLTIDGDGKVVLEKPYDKYYSSTATYLNLNAGELALKKDTNLSGINVTVNTATTHTTTPTLNLLNGTTENTNLNSLNVVAGKVLNVKIDADIAKSQIDKINSSAAGSSTGTISITDVHLLSDSDTKTTLQLIQNNSGITLNKTNLGTILTNKNLYNITTSGQNVVFEKSTAVDGLNNAVKTITGNRSLSLVSNAIVSSSLGSIASGKLNIYGNNYNISGNGQTGITVGNSNILNIDGVASLEGFSSDVITNNSIIENISNSGFKNNTHKSLNNTGTIKLLDNVTFENNTTQTLYNTGTIEQITDSSFINNGQYGLANNGKIELIYNTNFEQNGLLNNNTISRIYASTFKDNTNYSINNTSNINSIRKSLFTNNTEISILNDGTINEISGTTFENNEKSSIQNNANKTIKLIDNSIFKDNTSDAINNLGSIEQISNTTFINNKNALLNSGNIDLVYNTTFQNNNITNNSSIGRIVSSSFSDNASIINKGIIDEIYAKFTNNSTFSINNTSGKTIKLIENSIFTNNSNTPVINNSGDIIEISLSEFSNNSAGAIHNTGNIEKISDSIFNNNKISSAGGNGAALNNTSSEIEIINTSFTNNTATQYGGAIYTNKNITLKALSDNIKFTGNSAAQGNDIYLDNGADLNLYSIKNQSINFNGGITGTTGSNVNIEGFGKTIINAPVENVAVNIYGSEISASDNAFQNVDVVVNSEGSQYYTTPTINLSNGTINALNTHSFNVADGTFANLIIDVDAANNLADTINSTVAGTGKGTIRITGTRMLSMADSATINIINNNPNITLTLGDISLYTDKNKYNLSIDANQLKIEKDTTTTYDTFQSAVQSVTGTREVSLLNDLVLQSRYINPSGTSTLWNGRVAQGTLNIYGNGHYLTNTATSSFINNYNLNIYNTTLAGFHGTATGSTISGTGYLNLDKTNIINGNSTSQSNGSAVYANIIKNISDSKFIENYARGSYSALYAEYINSIKDSIFDSNKSYNGTAYSYELMDMTNTIFTNNISLFSTSILDALTIDNIQSSSFTKNESYGISGLSATYIHNISDTSFINNTSYCSSGAMNINTGDYMSGNSFIGNIGFSGTALNIGYQFGTIENTLFKNNISHSANAAIALPNIAIVELLKDNTFKSNRAASSAGAIGGGYITKIENSLFDSNIAGTSGGAIYSSYGIDEITTSTFKNNIAQTGVAGALYDSYFIKNINNTLFENNISYASSDTAGTSMGGGAIYIDNKAYINNISNDIFRGNASLTGRGGAIYAKYIDDIGVDAIDKISDSLFENNTAYANGGGAIFIDTNRRLEEINNTVFRNNSSYKSAGGALYLFTSSQPITISDSTFANNYSYSWGGAIYKPGQTNLLTINNTNFYNNSNFLNDGSAIQVDSNMVLTDSNFIGNKALNGNGGAIGISYSNLTINAENKNVLFLDNQAHLNGNDISIRSNDKYLYLNTEKDKAIYFDGGILLQNNNHIVINGDGKVVLDAAVKKASSTDYVDLNSGELVLGNDKNIANLILTTNKANATYETTPTLNILNGVAGKMDLASLNIVAGSTLNLKLDADLENNLIDTINTASAGSSAGTISITDIRLLTDGEKTLAPITNNALITLDVSKLPTILTNNNKYNITLDGTQKLKFTKGDALSNGLNYALTTSGNRSLSLVADANISSAITTAAGNINIYGNEHKITGASSANLNIANTTTLTMQDAIINNFSNTAITNSGTIANISNSIFENNSIALQNNTNATIDLIDNVTFKNNTSTTGALINNGNIKQISNSLFINSSSRGIHNNTGTIDLIYNSSFEQTGIYNRSLISMIYGSTFKNNSGVSIINYSGTIDSIRSTIFENNKGISIGNSGTIKEIANSTFRENSKNSIYNIANKTIESIDNTLFENNTDIVLNNRGIIKEISNSIFRNNEADAISNYSTGRIELIYNTTFENNNIDNAGKIDRIISSTFDNAGFINNGTTSVNEISATFRNNSGISITNNTDKTIKLIDNSDFYNNSGISINNNGTIEELTTSDFRHNTGTVVSNSGTIKEISNNIFTENEVSIENNSNINTISDNVFLKNTNNSIVNNGTIQ